MHFKEITQANRIAWNEAMPKHQVITKKKWDSLFFQDAFILQEGVELSKLKEIGIKGKQVAHFCCNNGIQLLSIKNLGAKKCVGFDISDEAISEAKERAQKCNIDCQFIQTDIYDIPEEYNCKFDIVYITIGALCWFPDLERFFNKVYNTLTPGGNVFIYEQHPFTELFPDDDSDENPLKVVNNYFSKEPYIGYNGIDYIGNTTYESSALYCFTHTLSDIIMGLINNQIKLNYFKEYSHNISEVCENLGKQDLKLPLSYIIIGNK